MHLFLSFNIELSNYFKVINLLFLYFTRTYTKILMLRYTVIFIFKIMVYIQYGG